MIVKRILEVFEKVSFEVAKKLIEYEKKSSKGAIFLALI